MRKKKFQLEVVSVRIHPELNSEISEIAEKTGESKSDFLRGVIYSGFKRYRQTNNV